MRVLPAVLIALVALAGLVDINASPVARSSELHDVLDEFLALVPKEKVVAVFMEYLQKDPEVQAVVEYMTSDGFRELVNKIESIEDVVNFYDYLEESGLDVYGLVNKLHEFIGLPPLVPDEAATMLEMRSSGVAGLLADIKAVLPLDDIKALYHDKLKTSPAFAQLVKRLGSSRCQELINALRANAEFRKIVAFARDAGIDVAAIKDLLTTIFGLEFPQLLNSPIGRFDASTDSAADKPVLGDLADFIRLLPVEKMAEVATEYVLNDAQVQKAVVYIRSEEFRHLFTDAQQNDEFRDFLSYLDESGLPAFQYVNHLNRYLAMPEVGPRSGAPISGGVGVRGMLDEIEALLPRAAIQQLYELKLQTSEPFAFMVHRLETAEFQTIVDRLVENHHFQKLGYRAADFGIELDTIVRFMSTVFGIEIPKP